MNRANISSYGLKLLRGLLAGFWFAAASTIPILFLIILLDKNFPTFGFRRRSIVALSILLSGIVGLFYGSAILNAEKIKNGFQASARGMFVGLLSYLLLYTVFAIPSAFIGPDIFSGLLAMSVFFWIGFVVVGWLVIITGTLAGWFLYLLREFWNEPESGN